jgi:hypothetical protein
LSSDGTRIAISSYSYDVKIGFTTYVAAGLVDVYEWDGNNWLKIGNSIKGTSNAEHVGRSLSLKNSGNRLAIGGTNYVKVFDYNGSNWSQIGYTIYRDVSSDGTGFTISLSSNGTKLAIGIPYSNNNGGKARVYDYINSDWNQIGLDIDGENIDNYLGFSVSLSSNGGYLAIGIPALNTSSPGQLRIFSNDNSNWTQLGSVINGKKIEDRFGYSVSISSNGGIIACGAPQASGYFGEVRVFSTNSQIALLEVIDDIKGNMNGINVTASQLNNINGLSGAIDGVNYTTALDNGTFVDENNPTVSEIQIIIDAVNSSLGLDDYSLVDFRVFPNPTNNFINVQLEIGIELQNITLYNNLGQFILSTKNTTVNTRKLSSGVYFVEIETNRGKASKKIIIE